MIVGTKVDSDFVKSYPQYEHVDVTPLLLSQVAVMQLTAVDSNAVTLQKQATDTVNAMKGDYGEGASTLVMVFNASGETLTYHDAYDWSGGLGKYNIDLKVENGEYCVFLHTKTRLFQGSVGCVVFRGELGSDFLFAWENPYWGQNSIYADVQANDYWPNQQSWDTVASKLDGTGRTSTVDNGTYTIFTSIGTDTSPIASFTIERKA